MVTAELAVGFLGVAAILALLLGVGSTLMAQLRCADAAYAAARAAGRGESTEGALGAARARAPDGAHVELEQSGDEVRALVTVRTRICGPLFPGVTVQADAVAAREVGDGAPAPGTGS
jgi:hypothetical protein